MNIKINGQSVELKFRIGLLRDLGALWGCAGLDAVVKKFTSAIAPMLAQLEGVDVENTDPAAFEGKNIDIPFEVLDMYADIVIMAACRANPEVELDSDDIQEHLLTNPTDISAITAEFLNAMPVPKPEPVGNAGKPKAGKAPRPKQK